MVVTTRSRKGAAAPRPEPNELTTAHQASATPVTGTTETPQASRPADRSAPGHRRSDSGHMGIPGAFSQSPIPQEPEPSSDEQEEDWVSDTVTEAAEAWDEGVQGNQDQSNPSEVSEEKEGEIPTDSEPSEVASRPAERQGEPRPARRPASAGASLGGSSQAATVGSKNREGTPVTPSFLADAEATARPSHQSTTPFQTPRHRTRVPPAQSLKGAFQGPKYFPHVLSVQYGSIHDGKDDEKAEGGSDETLRQSKTQHKRKSEAQQRAEDMAYMREIISNNRRLQHIRATLPDMIQNNKSLLEEISEILPEAVSGDEFDWDINEYSPEAPGTPPTRETSIKEVTPLSDIEVAPTYLDKGKWVCDDEHDARVAYKHATTSGTQGGPARTQPKKTRPSMGITIDEIRPPVMSPRTNDTPKTNDLRASITMLPAGGFFAERMKARYEKPKPPKRAEVKTDHSNSEDPSSPSSSESSETESSSEDEKSKRKREIRKLKKKLRTARKAKKVMPKDPAAYKGQDDMDAFEKWDFETEFWLKAHGMSQEKAVGHMSSFLDGKASQWYMDFVTPEPENWTVDTIKMGLFTYFFPPNIKEILRREFKYARQGNMKFIDYLRSLKRYQRRLPDITDRQICHKIWDTVHKYIKVKWIEAGMDSEYTGLQVLTDAAERYEKAENVLKSNSHQNNGNRNSNRRTWNTSGQTKPSDKSNQTEPNPKGESSKTKGDVKKKDGQQNKKDKTKGNKPKMSKEERDQLRAEGKCYACKEVGHTLKDCPTRNTAKPSGVYSAAVQYDKIEALRKEREQTYLSVASIQPLGSPSLTETNSEEPTAANDELLRITNDKSETHEIKYKEIAEQVRDAYLKRTEVQASDRNNPMVVLINDSEEKEEVWTSIEWEDSDNDSPKSLKEETLSIQLNAARIGKKREATTKHIERNASKPKDITRKLPKPIIVEATVNNQKVRALIDSGSLGDFISTTVVDQLKLPKETLANPIGLQMAVAGSRSTINYSVDVRLGFQSINCMRRFDVINIDNYDMILGTPFLYQHKVVMSFNPQAISVGSPNPTPIVGDEAFVIEAKSTQLYEKEIEKCREELREAGADLCKTMAETALPPLRTINHTIPLIDETKRYNTRRVQCPKPLQSLWDEKLRAYKDTGRWEYRPGSNATPMLLLMKKSKDGKSALRTVLDKREINANTYKLASPLPDINDILSEVVKHPYRSLIDGKDAYEQIRIIPEHVERSIFMTPNGTMVSKVMQQGDCNAGATYQALMNHIFSEYIGKFMFVYLDDIIIFSDTAEEHMVHVKKVFEVLRQQKLYLSPNKMQLFAERLEILGHVITSEGITMDPHKVDAVEKWKTPTTKEQLMSFLGAVGYLAPNCPNVRIPMAVLSKRASATQPWRWEATEQRAFQEVKDLVSAYRNHNRVAIDYSPGAPPINLTTDACCTGASGVLSQGDNWETAKVIAFWSGKLTATQQNYPVHEQELLAIKESLEKFKHYLHGVHVRVFTDHKALEFFTMQKKLSARQTRWMEKINDFDIEVKYIPGETNILADGLSRMYSNEPKGVVRAKSEYVNDTDQETPHILVGATRAHGKAMPEITQPLYVGDEIKAELEKRGEDAQEPRRSQRDKKPVAKYSAQVEETKRKKRKAKKPRVKASTANKEPEAKTEPKSENIDKAAFEPMTKSDLPENTKSDLIECVTEAKLPECVIGRYSEDPMLKIIMQEPSQYSNFEVHDGALYLKRDGEKLLCIPDIMIGNRKLREIIITHAHSILAHLGARKTTQWLRTQVWWKRMVKDISDYCESCHTCATAKTSTQNPKGLLHPMPIPDYPWQSIGVDFVGPLTSSETRYGEFDTIMTVIDNLTRMVHLVPTKSTYTSKDVAEVMYEHVYKLHGTPEIIVSDRDSLFTSDFWTRLAQLTKTELKMSSAYHPQTDGMTERMHRTYSAILRTCAGRSHNEWARHLPAIEFAINSARSEATGLSPFHLNYGRNPSPMVLRKDEKFPGVSQHIEKIKTAVMAAHDALIDARVRMIKQANEHRKPAEFEVGQLVYVSTKNMRIPKGMSRKLVNRYVGPYKISRVITEGASYELELGKDLRTRGIHPVFHASLLRPHIPVDDIRFPGRNFQQIASLGAEPEEWAVDRITAHRGKGRNADFEILWKSGDRTWEPHRIVRHLKALENYLEAKGVPSIKKLTDGTHEEQKKGLKTEQKIHFISPFTGYNPDEEKRENSPPTTRTTCDTLTSCTTQPTRNAIADDRRQLRRPTDEGSARDTLELAKPFPVRESQRANPNHRGRRKHLRTSRRNEPQATIPQPATSTKRPAAPTERSSSLESWSPSEEPEEPKEEQERTKQRPRGIKHRTADSLDDQSRRGEHTEPYGAVRDIGDTRNPPTASRGSSARIYPTWPIHQPCPTHLVYSSQPTERPRTERASSPSPTDHSTGSIPGTNCRRNHRLRRGRYDGGNRRPLSGPLRGPEGRIFDITVSLSRSTPRSYRSHNCRQNCLCRRRYRLAIIAAVTAAVNTITAIIVADSAAANSVFAVPVSAIDTSAAATTIIPTTVAAAILPPPLLSLLVFLFDFLVLLVTTAAAILVVAVTSTTLINKTCQHIYRRVNLLRQQQAVPSHYLLRIISIWAGITATSSYYDWTQIIRTIAPPRSLSNTSALGATPGIVIYRPQSPKIMVAEDLNEWLLGIGTSRPSIARKSTSYPISITIYICLVILLLIVPIVFYLPVDRIRTMGYYIGVWPSMPPADILSYKPAVYCNTQCHSIMSGPHRVKKRKTVKLHGPKYPYNSSFTESDPISQDALTPTHSLSLSALEARSEKSKRLVSQEYSKLSAYDRATLHEWVEEPMNNNDTIDDMDIVDVPHDRPDGMGENESESILRSIIPPARYRSWTERTHNASSAWSIQYEDLANAYLQFNGSATVDREPRTSVSVDEEALDETETFNVEAVDVFARHSEVSIDSRPEGCNVALVLAGYISPSPTNPTTAISIRTLDLFIFLRQRQPQLSIQAFAKTLCDLHKVPYKRYLRDQLSTALEVYLSILRILESRMLVELMRDGPDWQLKNACPPCTYKLEEEPELHYSMQVCGDGNNSLKRYLRSGEDDPRRFTDPRMLEPEYVDQYELNDARQGSTTTTENVSLDNAEDDLAPPSACAPRWKNARNENGKDTFDMLDETGIFTVLCRHGVVLVIADMVKSGERAKYPLAAFSKVVRAHGKNILIGYDIGCQHATTAQNHPKTRNLVRENSTEYIVGAFHGYAHERPCQLNWHPLWRTGAGMEDLEGCERWFSHSNGVARCTQHGTKYNRRLQIWQHIVVSDKDALANLGKFLYNRLESAASQLGASVQHRNQAMVKFGLKIEDFSTFVDCERQYLASPPPAMTETTNTIEYLNTLEQIDICQAELDKLNQSPMSAVARSKRPVNVDHVIAARRRYLTNQALLHMKNAHEFELELDIPSQWTKGSPEWGQAEELRQNRKLHMVVDKLERLCLERIFEMEKYLHGNTGYKLREMISKSLATRSKALKAAVQEYNEIACNSTPPRREISTREVMDLTKVADFQLLREYREEILTQKWTVPAIREATTHALRVERAREEILRVQVEVRRLETWMRDEVHHLAETLKRLETQNPLLAHMLRPQLEYQTRINSATDKYIWRIKNHPQFEGELGCGVRKLDADPAGFTPILESGPMGMVIDSPQDDGPSDDDIENEIESLVEGYNQIAMASNK